MPNKYDNEHLKRVKAIQRQVDAIYAEAISEAAALGVTIKMPNDAQPFTFDDYPLTKRRVDDMLTKLRHQLQVAIVNAVNSAWTLANNKNNELCNVVFGKAASSLTPAQRRKYYNNNDKAREAFLQRKENGLNLSDRVWHYSDLFKTEIEMGLDLGIRSGLDAPAMARDLKQYLQHPDMLFRRVRDEHGILHLSNRAAAFHPGQGVYRSSYKNARRLAVTETNMAYRTSDHERWQQLDFVVGIEISLSSNHTCLGRDGKPHEFTDICDKLKGKYPKDFKFTGWHPHCRCFATSILKTKEERAADRRRFINGEEVSKESENTVHEYPKGFTDWLESNEERIVNAKALPYFLSDNGKVVDGKFVINKPNAVANVEQPSIDDEERRQRILKAAEERHNRRGFLEENEIRQRWEYRRVKMNMDNFDPELRKFVEETESRWGNNMRMKLYLLESKADEIEQGHMKEYAPALAKKSKVIKDLSTPPDGETKIQKLIRLNELRKKCAVKTRWDLRKAKATDGLEFNDIDSSWSMGGGAYRNPKTGRMVKVDKVSLDLVVYKDKLGKTYSYPIGSDPKKIQVLASEASKIVQTLPKYMIDNFKGIVITNRTHPLDKFYKKAYDGFTQGAMYSSDLVTINYDYKNLMSYFRGDLCHEIGHHIDLKVGFRTSDLMKNTWGAAVRMDGGYPTSYSKTNEVEDFAESVSEYVNNPTTFRRKFPNRAAILDGIISQL